jgi:hypothetical protein
MSSRVTDEQVRHALTWARNYGDVLGWKRIATRGPKWLVKLAQQGVTIEHSGRIDAASLREMSPFLTPRALDVVPSELALTNREVLLLLYGIAAGAERPVPRADYRAAWDRGEKYEPDTTALAPRSTPS